MENNRVSTSKPPMEDDEFAAIWRSVHLKVTDTYDTPPEILWVNGSTIGTLGNFSASTGKAKSKKTFNISAIVAAALRNSEVLQYSAYLPQEKRKILYVDTEQSFYHCHKVLKSIMRLAGCDIDQNSKDFLFIVLREHTPERRREIIGETLRRVKGIGLVIIDGIRDLMYDINSPSESAEIINLLMRWSSEHNLHIHTVLHLNKGDDNTRGHIGTELNNKAETILQISKNMENGKISEVRAMHIRDKEFTPFAFEIGEDSLPHLVRDHHFKMSKKDRLSSYMDMSEEQHRTALEEAFSQNEVMGYQMLIDAIKKGYDSIGYCRGRNTLVNLCKFLIQHNAIVKEGRGYTYNSQFHL